MKKQVAIVSKKMITGGVERALIAMLKHIDYNQIDIDLYFEQLGGELYTELPQQVKVYQIPRIETLWDMVTHPLLTLKKIINRQRLLNSSLPYINQCHLSSTLLLPIKKKYDVAISYHAPNTIPVFYVIDSITAKKKILWLHGDLFKNAGETNIARRYHGLYNQVIAVSKYVENSFRHYHPNFEGSISTIYNFVDVDEIKSKANMESAFQDDYQGKRIVSVGRLDLQKGFDLAIKACHLLISNGFDIRWYICGEGQERSKLEELIKKYGLVNNFILLGNCNNPYPYIKEAYLYVQTSRTEGFCTTTNEAKTLCTPVITTRVSGADEQFENNLTGWIVDISAHSIAEQVMWCLKNPEDTDRVRLRLQMLNYSQAGYNIKSTCMKHKLII